MLRPLLDQLANKHALDHAKVNSFRTLHSADHVIGLGPLFAASRCADETNPKPHPAMLLELMEQLDVPRQETLMIGDTSHDMEMARAASVGGLAVTYGAHPEGSLRACSPLQCFSSVTELRQWLTANA